MKKTLILIFIALLSVASVSAYGVDDQGQPNDPATNERANACFSGGSMEGKCDTTLKWEAGWYLIRFEAGIFDRDDIPAYLNWVLPPPPPVEEVAAAVSAGCMITTPNYYQDSDYRALTDSVLLLTVPSFTNSCGDTMTPTVQLINNVSQGVPTNRYVCNIAGQRYEIRVTWASVSGSWTEFRTGNCTA